MIGRKGLLVVMTAVFLSASCAFAQEMTTRREGIPAWSTKTKLATIVFAGLGGAILGLSTLSFYGRPQDNLSNIAIGFAVGVIAGTTYVTIRSATTRDYYDEKPPQSLLGTPQDNVDPALLLRTKLEVADDEVPDLSPKFIYGPLVAKDVNHNMTYGGLVGLKF